MMWLHIRQYTAAVLLGCLFAVLFLHSCAGFQGMKRSEPPTHTKRAIEKNKKPRIKQLAPGDCPWDGNYRIKNQDRREYGSAYAAKQNRRMRDAL